MRDSTREAAIHAQKLWDQLGQVAKVEAAIDAWHAINNNDSQKCKFWKEVFDELDRLEAENTVQH